MTTNAHRAKYLKSLQRRKNAKVDTTMVAMAKVRAVQKARMQKSSNDLSNTKKSSNIEKTERLQSKTSEDVDGKNTAEITAANTERKKKSTGKRKGSGLTPKSIYLHDSVHNQFEELADDLGYEIGSKGLSSEQLSMLVQFLLDSYQKPTNTAVPSTKEGQYLYRVHQIIKYRSKTMRDTVDDIVDFMTESKYPVPESFSPKSKYDWTSQSIMTLLDKDSLSKKIKTLNGNLNIEDSSLSEGETNESEYISEDPDILYTGGVADLKEQIRKSEVIELGSNSKDPDTLYTGGVADLKEQIRKSGIIEQILSSASALSPTGKSDIKEANSLSANHLISLSDKDLFRHISMAEHKRVLTKAEVFEIYGKERRELVKRTREFLTSLNLSGET